jgi:hypothetical protein
MGGYLVGESEAYAEEDPVDEQHVDVDGSAPENGPGDEDGASYENGCAAAVLGGDGGGEEGGDETSNVEGGGEDGEELAVKTAVVGNVAVVSLHLVVDVREEFLEE